MRQTRKRRYGTLLPVAALIVCAIAARVVARYGYHMTLLGIVRAVIYIGLLTAWGISVRARIIQTQVRRYLLAETGLMLLWLLLRTVKYNVYDPITERLLWYGYYLPMLFIPVLAVLVALSLAYCAAYIKGIYWVWLLAGDLTVSLCLIITVIFESCIQCGLIQSNTGYDALFAASTVRARITDARLQLQAVSAAANRPLSADEMRRAAGGEAVHLDEQTLLRSHPIHQGYVLGGGHCRACRRHSAAGADARGAARHRRRSEGGKRAEGPLAAADGGKPPV